MRNITVKFKFNAVGQGGFYTGRFLHEATKQSFNIAYDCGSLSKRRYLEGEIDRFESRIEKLDVLFISHLDDDHVNGIRYLLRSKTCDRVYLPYLSPFQRLVLAVRHLPKDTADYVDYIEFLESPHKYLLERNFAKKVIYISGNSKDGVQFPDDKPDGTKDDVFRLDDNLEPFENDTNENFENFRNAVEFKKANGTIKIADVWEFFLHHEPADNSLIELLREKIESFFPEFEGIQLSAEQLRVLLGDTKILAELRVTFRKLFTSLNKAGLIMLHKQVDSSPFWQREYHSHTYEKSYFYRHYFPTRFWKINSPVITLLLGDISMSQIANSSYIRSMLPLVSILQVPHHGSSTGWDHNYLFELSRPLAMINFGYGNTYGHPKPNVIEDLNAQGIEIFFITQFDGFSYGIAGEE